MCQGWVRIGSTTPSGSTKRASLPKGMEEDDVTIELALKWLSLPRSLGTDNDGEEVVATSGRFGPYVKRGKDTRSIPATDDVYTIGLERALELLAQPKGRRGRAARTVLEELGKDSGGKPKAGLTGFMVSDLHLPPDILLGAVTSSDGVASICCTTRSGANTYSRHTAPR